MRSKTAINGLGIVRMHRFVWHARCQFVATQYVLIQIKTLPKPFDFDAQRNDNDADDSCYTDQQAVARTFCNCEIFLIGRTMNMKQKQVRVYRVTMNNTIKCN